MAYLIGVVLAAVVCAFAMLAGFDRDRVFYPTLLAAIATYYILSAVMWSSTPVMIIESLVAGAFLMLGLAGFKRNLWVIVVALAGQGVFDFCHHVFIQNPGCSSVVARTQSATSPLYGQLPVAWQKPT
jgi:hypothetical protein